MPNPPGADDAQLPTLERVLQGGLILPIHHGDQGWVNEVGRLPLLALRSDSHEVLVGFSSQELFAWALPSSTGLRVSLFELSPVLTARDTLLVDPATSAPLVLEGSLLRELILLQYLPIVSSPEP